MKRAQILLKADEGLKDANIMSDLNTSRPTVECIRKRFVEGGVEKGLVVIEDAGGQVGGVGYCGWYFT